MARGGVLAVAAVAVVAASACGLDSRPPGSIGPEVLRRAQQGDFILELVAARDRWQPGEHVIVSTRITYTGPDELVVVWHGGDGPVVTSLEQLDGPFDPGGGSDLACRSTNLGRDEPLEESYAKSGGYSADDPMAAQYTAWFDDALTRPPAGTYRFRAVADFAVGECAPATHHLETSLDVVVGG
jgi:hypothetical protein